LHLTFSYSEGAISIRKNGTRLAHAQDRALPAGYCFLGVKGGSARLRSIRISAADQPRVAASPIEYERILSEPQSNTPRVSIVTTVYDRVECLRRCLKSVKALNFKDYEHIIVADSPSSPVLQKLKELVIESDQSISRITLATLKHRRNDWGISPACAGLELARGSYISFLSDDNGYMPNHFERLVRVLDTNAHIGFAYSSCQYAGRAILRHPFPRPAGIDLGQPLFRRELFDEHLGGTIPFHEFGWDWRMIEAFLQHGVQCRHVDEPTFIFRLANYPQLLSEAAM
jgi:glycosyltransferase involved in cell wall biosynthesis